MIDTTPKDGAYQIKMYMLRVQQYSQVVNGAGYCPVLADQSYWKGRHHSKPPLPEHTEGGVGTNRGYPHRPNKCCWRPSLCPKHAGFLITGLGGLGTKDYARVVVL